MRKLPSPGFMVRIYVPAIAKGLWITTRHFLTNLFIHTAHLFGLMKHYQGAVTYQYPEQAPLLAPRARTRHRLMKREDKSPRCVACMMCETVCPARCISIVGEEHPDPQIEKRPKSFVIDLGLCVYCGYCVEACPVDAIRMDTGIVDLASTSREGMIYDMDRLLNEGTDGLPS
jgi:NADH-quinone oxidoreductase subunit I